MKKGTNILYSPADNKIDILQYLLLLKTYSGRFFIAFIAGFVISFSYFYFIKPPLNNSSLIVEVGFGSINEGQYPNGSVFKKDDLLADQVLRRTWQRISAETSLEKWPYERFKRFFSVEEVYPLEIQLAKETLESKSGGRKPEEIVLNYQKVMDFHPAQYKINFMPVPRMPAGLVDKIFAEQIAQFSNFIVESKLPVFIEAKSLSVLEGERVSYPAAFSELEKRFDLLQQFVEKSGISYKKGHTGEVIDNAIDIAPVERKRLVNPDPMLMNDIRTHLSEADFLIYDRKAVADVEICHRQLETQAAKLSALIAMLNKQCNFRLYIASMPKNGDVEKAVAGKGVDPRLMEASPDASVSDQEMPVGKSIMNLLLTYIPEYYSLMNEARTLYDRKALLEKELTVVNNRLARLEKPLPANSHPEMWGSRLIEELKLAEEEIKKLSENIEVNYRKNFVSFEPPVRSSFILHEPNKFPVDKVIFAGIASLFAVIAYQVVAIAYSIALERQRITTLPVPVPGEAKVR